MLRNSLIIGLTLLISPLLYATTIMQVGIDELSKKSELVFEGKVLSKSVRPSSRDGRPCTYFQFDVIDVIKGSQTQPEIELCFTGGTLNGKTLRVSGMTMPQVGESGIYFVTALGKEPVHPLKGWHQGHYLVKTDSARVRRVVPAHPQRTTMQELVNRKAQRLQSAPDIETFKRMIRDKM